ncbi:MAG TPA: hypothetical protein DEP69_00255, partial [Acidimicrobiaceae bacterium]|nr:hypothetical protein [Acidimicrobiaceae bacterium]
QVFVDDAPQRSSVLYLSLLLSSIVFVFFGLVATAGSAFVQDGRLTALPLGAAVPVGLAAVALLVANNLRDRPGDAESGKRTLAVLMGDRGTRVLYVALTAALFVSLPYLALVRPWALLALAALPLAVMPVRAVLLGRSGRDLIPVLAGTARLQLGFGVALTVGLALGA